MIRLRALALSLLLLAFAALPAIARADFGFVPGSIEVTALNRDGTIATQAGSHPYEFIVHFELKTDGTGKSEGGELRDVLTDLPPGLFGNPLAVPSCPRQSFEGGQPKCDPNTQVGVLSAILPGTGEAFGPIYNLTPQPGAAAQLGFSAASLIALISGTADPENGYGIHLEARDLPVEATQATVRIWGMPADPAHDPERGPSGGLPAKGAQLLPFLTLPTSCEAPPQLIFEIDSKLAPGAFVGGDEPEPMRDKADNPVTLSGCEAVPFSPKAQAGPSTSAAESPSGFGFQLKLPNQGLLNPKEGAVTETEPERVEVALPEGITANPAAVNGQGVCTPAQFKAASATSPGCPAASKLGTLLASTPLLAEPIEGAVYLAAPHENPFDSLLALYIVAAVPERGLIVKQAGEVHPDPATGQLTASFDGLPPIPYSSLEMHLREGPRAPLITPQLCGPYTTTAKLYPFSDPGTATVRTAPFTISSGAGGGACAPSTAQLPFAPTLQAGTTAPLAGAYSPFLFKLSRDDGEQRLSALEATLPEGLAAKLAGIPYCPEAAIAAAAARSGEGEGAAEVAAPSCPAASEVGGVSAGAGAGPTPYYVQGKAYLAGPYKGAPLSLAIVTPAIAGPFDLGVVVVRAALYVNESSAEVTVKSDPLPAIIHGFPLDLRSVAVRTDRPNFTLNPTSCAVKQITAAATSQAGVSVPLSERFQAGGCRGLEFKPKLKISLKGPTRRTGHPALKAVVTFPKESHGANIASTQVSLPPGEFLDQANLNKVCTQPQLRSQSCPPSSVYGHAKAWSPLLDAPLEGPVYLGVGYGHQLPDIVADLNGQIRILVHGKVDTTKKRGLRNTFEVVPDAPVSRFVLEMKGGKKYGLLVNSENVCAKTQRAKARFVGQNGKVSTLNPKIENDCGKGKQGK